MGSLAERRDEDDGDLKVGTKVTIQYTMTAVSIDAKASKKDAAAAASPK